LGRVASASRLVAMASFPRPRRLRRSVAMRELVAETTLRPEQLVLPLFVKEGLVRPQPIPSMPGVVQHSIDSLLGEVDGALAVGVRTVILFGVTDARDEDGSLACRADFVLERAIGALVAHFGEDLTVISDLCLDEYTTHGHCGVLDPAGRVDNDATLLRYQELALALAAAGVHLVGPSGMMDHQVAAIREALDANGYDEVGILAYSAKYASALYGPFRDAVEVTIAGGGDRATYQQDPRNRREAAREVELDVAEGADLVMVKPASFYLDVLSDVAAMSPVPVLAYQVSGEYSMIEAAAERGWLDRRRTALESLTAIRRAGADAVLTYYAKEAAAWLR
jgi:porphobilinogen synthase